MLSTGEDERECEDLENNEIHYDVNQSRQASQSLGAVNTEEEGLGRFHLLS